MPLSVGANHLIYIFFCNALHIGNTNVTHCHHRTLRQTPSICVLCVWSDLFYVTPTEPSHKLISVATVYRRKNRLNLSD